MTTVLPGVVRCSGRFGCGQILDLGADPTSRGMTVVAHLRDEPAHQAQSDDIGVLLANATFITL